VTGACGFIGSTLVKKLVQEGKEVLALDKEFRYGFRSLLANLSKEEKRLVHPMSCDICDLAGIKDVFRKYAISSVIHLAAIPGERLCRKYVEEAFRTNIFGTYILLKESVLRNVNCFILASSQVVYGHPLYLPVDEGHPIQPYDIYSYTKACNELMTKQFKKEGLNILTVRFSSIYGFGVFARWYEVTGKFAINAVEGKDLTIYRPPNLKKPGEQVIDFLHVKDLVNAIVKLLIKSDNVQNETFNISSGKGTSIIELAEIAQKIAYKKYGNEIGFKYVDSDEEEIPNMVLSISKVKKKLGWCPKIDLEEGIADLMRKYIEIKMQKGIPRDPSLIDVPLRETRFE